MRWIAYCAMGICFYGGAGAIDALMKKEAASFAGHLSLAASWGMVLHTYL